MFHSFQQWQWARFPRSNSPLDTKSKAQAIVKFYFLKYEWQSATKGMSLSSEIFAHSAYQSIIKMGYEAVPFMLNDLQLDSSLGEYPHWFWALHVITGSNPVKECDEGDIKKMAEAWIEWGKVRSV